MKTNKFLLIGIGAAFIFTLVIFLGYPETSNAAEKCAIVDIVVTLGLNLRY